MSAQDNIEKVLRNVHVLLSKSEPYAKEPTKVILDKQEMLDLLSELNKAIYDIMDEYELTKQSRDRAEREFKRQGDEIIWNASRKAEDIYAASVMYTDEALNHIQDIIRDTETSVAEVYEEMNKKIKEQEKMIKTNQLELKSTLQDLVDTEKYLKLIEERNKEIQKEKEKGKSPEEREVNIYADRHTGIKINQEYFDKMGISMEDVVDDEEKPQIDISVDLDAEYFKWKEEQAGSTEKKEKPDRLSSMFKAFGSKK